MYSVLQFDGMDSGINVHQAVKNIFKDGDLSVLWMGDLDNPDQLVVCLFSGYVMTDNICPDGWIVLSSKSPV